MENRIPIDELFHDKLSQGSEQMNLGAWANMERMLDGKNPYASEEEKKRRGLIPFFFIFLLGIGITGAGYYIYNKSSHELANTAQSMSTSHATVAQSFNTPSQTSNSITNNQTQSISEDITTQNKDNQRKNSINSTHTTSIGNSTLVQTTSTNNSTYSRKKSQPIQSTSSIGVANVKTTSDAHKPSDIVNEDQTNFIKDHSEISRKNNKHLKDDLEQNQSYPASQTNTQSLVATKVKEVTTMPAVTIASREKRKNDGSLESILHDTIGTSTYEKVTERVNPEVVTASLDPMVTNPRYKKLSAEEELNAKIQQAEPMKREESIVNATTSQTVESNSESTTSSISINSNQHKNAVQHTGYFEDLKKFFLDTYTKVSNFMLYTPKPNWYTGLNMGVNMSLSNSQNNFGGFQGGFTALAPINDYFSFVTELKFYYRKNGG